MTKGRLLGACLWGLAWITFVSLRQEAVGVEPLTLSERGDVRWWRGNLHTHSHWSDGDDYLESIALWYQGRGYNFLVFTDHNVLADQERWVAIEETKGGERAFEKLQRNFPDWIEQRLEDGRREVRLRRFDEVAERFNRPNEFLLIQGEEISDRFKSAPIHLNASNILTLIQPQGGTDVASTIQNNVRAVLAQREATGQPMIVHLNHPNFGFGVTAEDLMRVQGDKFFEVYNGHPAVHNQGDHHHAGTERIWDIVLAHRLERLGLPVMYGLAVDDSHNYHDIPSRHSEPGRGWVMVLSSELTAEALIEALENGRFYASSGVTLKRIETTPQTLTVEVEPRPDEDYVIEFVGTRKGADLEGEPIVDDQGQVVRATHRYSPEIGEVLKRAEGAVATYTFQGDELYVRARVRCSALHPNPSEPGEHQMAWVQPVVLIE